MAIKYRVLGQAAPAAATPTTLYTVPALTEAVISAIVACNRGVSTTVRVAVRPDGAALAPEHYVAYDIVVPANDSLPVALGITMDAGDIITVYAGTANVSFNVFGAEQEPDA